MVVRTGDHKSFYPCPAAVQGMNVFPKGQQRMAVLHLHGLVDGVTGVILWGGGAGRGCPYLAMPQSFFIASPMPVPIR